MVLQVVSEELGHRLETVTADMLGSAKKVGNCKPGWHGFRNFCEPGSVSFLCRAFYPSKPGSVSFLRRAFHPYEPGSVYFSVGLCILPLKSWLVDEPHRFLFDCMLILGSASREHAQKGGVKAALDRVPA